jgi:hypothetical protein
MSAISAWVGSEVLVNDFALGAGFFTALGAGFLTVLGMGFFAALGAGFFFAMWGSLDGVMVCQSA